MSTKEHSTSKDIRRTRLKQLIRRLLLWVLMPTLGSIVYYGFVATSQYESIALVTVQTNATGKAQRRKVEAMLIREYALSHAMLDTLVKHHGYAAHYQDKSADFHSRLSRDASSEQLYEYFRDHTRVHYLPDSNALKIRVRAFSGTAAQDFALAIISTAESMANHLDDRPATAALNRAQRHREQAKKDLELAISQRAKSTKAVIPELGSQSQPAAAPTTEAKTGLVMQQVAERRYQESLSALVKARDSQASQRLYISTISAPSLATGSAYPRRLWSIASVFVLSLVLMSVVTMLSSAIKEHARF